MGETRVKAPEDEMVEMVALSVVHTVDGSAPAQAGGARSEENTRGVGDGDPV